MERRGTDPLRQQDFGCPYGREQKNYDLEGDLADVFFVVLSLCRVTNIDLFTAFKNKELRNSQRTWK